MTQNKSGKKGPVPIEKGIKKNNKVIKLLNLK